MCLEPIVLRGYHLVSRLLTWPLPSYTELVGRGIQGLLLFRARSSKLGLSSELESKKLRFSC